MEDVKTVSIIILAVVFVVAVIVALLLLLPVVRALVLVAVAAATTTATAVAAAVAAAAAAAATTTASATTTAAATATVAAAAVAVVVVVVVLVVTITIITAFIRSPRCLNTVIIWCSSPPSSAAIPDWEVRRKQLGRSDGHMPVLRKPCVLPARAWNEGGSSSATGQGETASPWAQGWAGSDWNEGGSSSAAGHDAPTPVSGQRGCQSRRWSGTAAPWGQGWAGAAWHEGGSSSATGQGSTDSPANPSGAEEPAVLEEDYGATAMAPSPPATPPRPAAG